MFTTANTLKDFMGTRGVSAKNAMPRDTPAMNADDLAQQVRGQQEEDTTLRGSMYYDKKTGGYFIDHGDTQTAVSSMYQDKTTEDYVVVLPDGTERMYSPEYKATKPDGVEDTTLVDGSDGNMILDGLSRTGGVILGTLNAPFAMSQELSRSAADPNVAWYDMPEEAIRSGLKSMFKKNSWGTTYGEAFNQITGMSINDYFKGKIEGKYGDNYETKIMSVINPLSTKAAVDYTTDNFLTSFNPDEEARRKESIKALTGLSAITHEMMLSVAADPLLVNSVGKGIMVPVSKMLAKIKSNRALMKVPEYSKMVKEMERLKGLGSLRYFHILETINANPVLKAVKKRIDDGLGKTLSEEKMRSNGIAMASKAKKQIEIQTKRIQAEKQNKAILEAQQFLDDLSGGAPQTAAGAKDSMGVTLEKLAMKADEIKETAPIPKNVVDPKAPAASIMSKANRIVARKAGSVEDEVEAIMAPSITETTEDIYTGLNADYKNIAKITGQPVKDPEMVVELAKIREELMNKAYNKYVDGEAAMGKAYKKSVDDLVRDGNSPEMIREYSYAKENAMRDLEGRPRISDPEIPATKEATFEQNLLGASGFEQVGKLMDKMGKGFIKAGKWARDEGPIKLNLSEDTAVVMNAINRMVAAQMKGRKVYSKQEGPLHHIAESRGFKLKVDKYGKAVLESMETGKQTKFNSVTDVRKRLAPEYKSEKEFLAKMNEVEINSSTDVELDAFYSYLFPDGVEFATGKQLLKSGEKLEKLILKGKKGKLKLGSAAKNVNFPEWVMGQVPGGKKFYHLIRRAKSTEKNLFGYNWGKLTDEWKTYRKKYKISKNEHKEQIRQQLDSAPVKGADGKFKLDKDGNVIERSLAYLDPENIGKEFAEGTVRPLLGNVLKSARKAGVEVKGYVENYFPHRIPSVKALRKGKKREEILEATVKEGWFDNIEEATVQLDNFIARIDNNSNHKYLDWMIEKGLAKSETQARVLWDSVFDNSKGIKYSPIDGSLKFSRESHTPFYDRNFDTAMVSYFQGTSKSIASARVLGGSGLLKVDPLLRSMRTLYGDSIADHAQKMLNYHLGVERPDTLKNLGKFAKTMQTFKLNHLSSVLNMTQGLATGVRVGGIPFFKTLGKAMFSSKGRKEITEYGRHMGSAMAQTLSDVETMLGGGTISSSYLKGIGFRKTEQIIRGFSANVGKEGALMKYKQFSKLMEKGKAKDTKEIRRWFKSLDVDVAELHKSKVGLTDETLDYIASRVSDEVNFTGTEVDLPMSWLGPGGQVVTQFKSFVYGQSKLLAKSVAGEALKGNLKPAAFLFTIYPPVGMSFDFMINEVIRGKDGPDSHFERYCRGLMAVGGVAMFESVLFGLHYGLAEAALGPTLGDMTDGAEKLFRGNFDVTRDLLGRYGPFGINTGVRRMYKENKKGDDLRKAMYK